MTFIHGLDPQLIKQTNESGLSTQIKNLRDQNRPIVTWMVIIPFLVYEMIIIIDCEEWCNRYSDEKKKVRTKENSRWRTTQSQLLARYNHRTEQKNMNIKTESLMELNNNTFII